MFNLRISYAFTFLFGLCAADRAKVSSIRKGNAGFVIDRESIVGFSVIFVVRYLDFETGFFLLLLFFWLCLSKGRIKFVNSFYLSINILFPVHWLVKNQIGFLFNGQRNLSQLSFCIFFSAHGIIISHQHLVLHKTQYTAANLNQTYLP